MSHTTANLIAVAAMIEPERIITASVSTCPLPFPLSLGRGKLVVGGVKDALEFGPLCLDLRAGGVGYPCAGPVAGMGDRYPYPSEDDRPD